MEMRLLGKTGLRVSELCLGTMTFGGRTEATQAVQIVNEALDLGINFMDTADSYSGGRSEELLGAALRERGARARVVLASKCHFPVDELDVNARGNSRRHILSACEASLRRLGTDWIDILYIHRPEPLVPIQETLRALDDLVRAGKVRYIGSSTFAAWQIVEALWASERLRANRIVVEQPPYHLLDRRIERELLPMAKTQGVGVVTWAPLAGGLLSGKYGRRSTWPAGSRYEVVKDPHMQRRYSPGVDAVVDALRGVAERNGWTLTQLSIAWVLAQPEIVCPIIGPRTVEQFRDNAAALTLKLDAGTLRELDEICPPHSCVAPFYELES